MYLSSNQEAQYEPRNHHTPVKLQQNRFESTESDRSNNFANENQAIDRFSNALKPPRSTNTKGDQMLNERYGRIVDNFNNYESLSRNQKIDKTNPLASEHFAALLSKQSEMKSRSEYLKENHYDFMNDLIEGNFSHDNNGYNNSALVTQTETATLRNLNSSHKERFLDAKHTLSTIENQSHTPKGFKVNKLLDEGYDQNNFGDDDEFYSDQLLTQSPFDGHRQLSYNMQSASIDMFLQANNKSISASTYQLLSQQTSTDSRAKIEERLKLLEQKLREMELRNQGLKVEKDKVQLEFEKLLLELKQAKIDTSALGGDKKDEKELALKNEIKFLISKLLKVKNKLERQNEKVAMSQDLKRRPSLENSSVLNSVQNFSAVSGGPLSVILPSNSQNNYTQSSSYHSHKEWPQNLYQKTVEDQDLKPSKGSLGEAIENFSKNIRSKSNMRSEGSKPGPMSNYNNVVKASNRARTPLLARPEERLSVPRSHNVNNSMINVSASWNRKNL